MQERNRVVHDQWVAFPETPGVITRFGFFPGADEETLQARGIYTHEEWEELLLCIWHAFWRVSWIPSSPMRTLGGSAEMDEQRWMIVRGEFTFSEQDGTVQPAYHREEEYCDGSAHPREY